MKNEEIIREAIRVGILAQIKKRIKMLIAKRKGKKAYEKFLKKHNLSPSEVNSYPNEARSANNAFNVLDALL